MSIYPPVRDDLARLLSQPRLDEYKKAVGGKLEPALQLYAWNLEVSAALYESLHYFEVAFRNTIDAALTAWAASLPGPSAPWYRHPGVPLHRASQKVVREAIGRTTYGGRPELGGRVVAELSLGFWGGLLSNRYNRSLWAPCLRTAFPTSRRNTLHDAVDELRRLRNRIAHHEPVHGRDLVEDYRILLDTAERVSPRLPWWIDTTSRVPAVLYRKP